MGDYTTEERVIVDWLVNGATVNIVKGGVRFRVVPFDAIASMYEVGYYAIVPYGNDYPLMHMITRLPEELPSWVKGWHFDRLAG